MRSKLIIGLIILSSILSAFFCCANSGESEGNRITKVLFSARSKEAVLAWGKCQGNFSRSFEYEHEGKRIIVFLIMYKSGVVHNDIFIYYESDNAKHWSLVLCRPTDTWVTVQKKDENLVFKSRAGQVILKQPLDAVDLF